MENDLIYIDVDKRVVTANGPLTLSFKTDIKMGELVALFGPSGVGKTTLLRMLAGLTNPDRGTIRFGSEVWFDSVNKINVVPQKRNISLMFQDYALFPNMSVEENLLFAQTVENRDTVEILLAAFGLTEFKKRKPNGLSGGQKQRVALARALARKPQLLLLDEPLSALDAEMRSTLQEEIAKAHKLLGATTIMVSHDLNEVFRIATRVITLKDGAVDKLGTPDEVFSNTAISGKVQITGQIARIERHDTVNILTVISGGNQITKVIAFDSDIENMQIGDSVMVFTKAFNPIISKIN